MYAKPFGYCDLHEREVWEQEFERKGCWNCYRFDYSEDCPYADDLHNWLEIDKRKHLPFGSKKLLQNIIPNNYFVQVILLPRDLSITACPFFYSTAKPLPVS